MHLFVPARSSFLRPLSHGGGGLVVVGGLPVCARGRVDGELAELCRRLPVRVLPLSPLRPHLPAAPAVEIARPAEQQPSGDCLPLLTVCETSRGPEGGLSVPATRR